MPVKLKPWIAIRADGDHVIGTGHVMRCLALAEVAIQRGFSCRLLCRSIDPYMAERAVAIGVNILQLSAPPEPPSSLYEHSGWLSVSEVTDAQQCTEALMPFIAQFDAPRFIVVDHYALGAPWHIQLRTMAPVLAIDELNDRPIAPDWLVDQTVGKPNDAYGHLTPDYTHCLLGGDYALLRPEFAKVAEKIGRCRSDIPNVLKILVTMGGVDEMNISAQVLEWLGLLKGQLHMDVTVVASATSAHLRSLQQSSRRTCYPSQLIVNADNMAELMAEHHIAIGAAGTTAWERCALGLPSLNVELAANQQAISSWLVTMGVSINLGPVAMLSQAALCNALLDIVHEPVRYQQMVAAAFELVDGYGTGRVLDTVLT
ncbi:MAG: UDP-2,4-diacetamido-2,4,6-trideoxy-beta-L-altropyranose hydrolase [Gammaproteobacteria bacterium]|nr:UDP-2,4-diacetamido-2,4,6-trideoxy-beta-L-altropyranose hydrolase [Gammaproteobacteria bacterium]MCP4089690.1 UDP-2,4-diacetamido-2,4,6-trideoxy-beta-L-altropyranose hydrolase [Gammaproteobacteria bacterium]MCP4833116.1 UDP-2,4-diacetamido-2,4,6-trideoxy-beta-L-altropyranose hydrolase [Gammaproteobacteria bacterium]